MSNPASNARSHDSPTSPTAVPRRRWTYGVLALALLMVLMPYLFWHATWFGRPLSDSEISAYLADTEHPRKIQQALSKIADRIIAGDTGVRQWYPTLEALARSPVDEIRVTDAWVMGQDNSVAEFHAALLRLLHDANPMVQRNAALSLVRFGDDSGHDVILSMLEPYAVPAPVSGRFERRLKIGEKVNSGTLIARMETSDRVTQEVRTTVPGTIEQWSVEDGAEVSSGQTIALLAPDEQSGWAALYALYFVGQPGDVPRIEEFLKRAPALPPNVADQARRTLQALRARRPS